ncbi:MAG: hypothetical protein WED33_09770 [Bacteroidia bacterium]
MKKSIYYIISSLAIILIISSCDHKTDIYDGPNLIDRFGEFIVIDSLSQSRTTVDFSTGEDVVFTAKFNKNIDWIIEITGTESGAKKIIEGFNKDIDASNAKWTGGTTELPFFKNEICSVRLTVPEEPDFVDSAFVEITGTKIYEGTLFTDFEAEPGQNIDLGNFEFELTPNSGRKMDGLAAQGETYYLLEGTDNVVSNFFVGLININSTIAGSTYAPLPTYVPEDLFFNCFIYSDGGPHGIAVIQFVFDTNDNGQFDDGVDQTFQIEGDFPLNWVGWRHIKHSMADVNISQAQLEKLVSIRVLLISDKNAKPTPPLQVDFGIDYMIFTQGAPLEL